MIFICQLQNSSWKSGSLQPAIKHLETQYHLTEIAHLDRLIVDYIPDGQTREFNILVGNDNTNDMIMGMGGDDLIDGKQGNDLMYGGDGNDKFIANYGKDVVYGGAGTNRLDAGGYDGKLTTTTMMEKTGQQTINITNGRISVFEVTTKAYDIQLFTLSKGDDVVKLELAPNSTLTTIDAGNGNNDITISGPKPLEIFTGSGNDIIRALPAGSKVQTGAGNDIINVSNVVLVTDADANDRIMYADKVLTGGVRNAESESPYANGLYGVRYGIDTDGELQIIDPSGNVLYLANYNNTLTGPFTAGISVVQTKFGAYRLLAGPGDFGTSDDIFLVEGSALKALTGKNPFTGQDPIVLDLDGDGIELTARTAVSQVFDLDSNKFAVHSGWVRPDDAFLARDVNNNGKIDNGSELIGTATAEGFAANNNHMLSHALTA